MDLNKFLLFTEFDKGKSGFHVNTRDFAILAKQVFQIPVRNLPDKDNYGYVSHIISIKSPIQSCIIHSKVVGIAQKSKSSIHPSSPTSHKSSIHHRPQVKMTVKLKPSIHSETTHQHRLALSGSLPTYNLPPASASPDPP